jgi:ribosomal protein S1
MEVDGFVPISHLAKPNLAKPADGYAVGDTLELLVIEFNKDNKKIILSERLLKEPSGGDEGGKRKGKGKGKKAAEGEAVAAEIAPEVSAEADEAFREAVGAAEPPVQPSEPQPATDEAAAAN